MSIKAAIGGFNTSLQQVDNRYSWINDMIESRQELVVAYMKLINLDFAHVSLEQDRSGHNEGPVEHQIIAFCEHLIDYISHGHFDLYPKIVELIENASGRSLSIARRVMPRIEKTTEYLMKFSDRYAEDLTNAKLDTFKSDLAKIGSCLEIRFRCEDRLIIGLRLVHSLVATPTNEEQR